MSVGGAIPIMTSKAGPDVLAEHLQDDVATIIREVRHRARDFIYGGETYCDMVLFISRTWKS